MAKAFIPNPLKLPQVNHIDGNPGNNSVDNLEWCDIGRNMSHAVESGLIKRGSQHPRAKIDEKKAIKILNLLELLYPKEVSEILGISKHIIEDIKRGRTWYHLK